MEDFKGMPLEEPLSEEQLRELDGLDGVEDEELEGIETELEEEELPEDPPPKKTVSEVMPSQSRIHMTPEELERYEEMQLEKEVPGRGDLFHIRDKWLPETSELSDGECATFAVGDTQQEIYNFKRKDPLYVIFRNRLMRYRVSKGRQGRKERVVLHQLNTEEKLSNTGGAYDRP